MARSKEWAPHSPVDFASLQVGVCNQVKEEQPWRADGVLGSRARLMQSSGHSVGNQMNSFEQAVQWLKLYTVIVMQALEFMAAAHPVVPP